MKVLVLGSGAGGGFPQWNCNCRLCAGQRHGELAAHARTQSSIAVSADGEAWVLLNASPDIGTQIRNHPQLHPRRPTNGALRDTPIKAVALMDAQIDHVTGLLGLREGPPIDLYATPCVFEDLTTGLPLNDARFDRARLPGRSAAGVASMIRLIHGTRRRDPVPPS